MADYLEVLNQLYDVVKSESRKDISSDVSGCAIHDLAVSTLKFLENECEKVPLKSLVHGKEYFSFARKGMPKNICRPANKALFILDAKFVTDNWHAWWDGKLKNLELARMSYTIALAPCLAMELYDRQNKKQPATYFECLVGHIFAKAIGETPHKKATFKIEDRPVRMTMDFLFNMGEGARHIHLPVKMSTRERVVQAWAHQRLLDAAFGEASYKGIMILFGETKLDIRKREVVEICVPDQWLAYQALLSKMDRIYYFDVPNVYAELARKYPKIMPIKIFGDFFTEKEEVLAL